MNFLEEEEEEESEESQIENQESNQKEEEESDFWKLPVTEEEDQKPNIEEEKGGESFASLVNRAQKKRRKQGQGSKTSKPRPVDQTEELLNLDETHDKLKQIIASLLKQYDETADLLKNSQNQAEKIEKEPIPLLSSRQLKKLRKKKAEEVRKKNFHYMPTQNVSSDPDLAKDIEVLKLRSVLAEGKRHAESYIPSEKFHVGTIIEGPTDFYSGRLKNKERKASLAQEWLADPEVSKRIKVGYEKLVSKGPKLTLSEYYKKANSGSKKKKRNQFQK